MRARTRASEKKFDRKRQAPYLLCGYRPEVHFAGGASEVVDKVLVDARLAKGV